MSLLLPDAGLLFWMLLAFGIVFFILYKYGFPVITGMIDERKRFIDDSLRNAKEANEKLANIKQESEAILKAAYDEQTRILREAAQIREQIINEACVKAGDEGEKMLAEVRTHTARKGECSARDTCTGGRTLHLYSREGDTQRTLDRRTTAGVYKDTC